MFKSFQNILLTILIVVITFASIPSVVYAQTEATQSALEQLDLTQVQDKIDRLIEAQRQKEAQESLEQDLSIKSIEKFINEGQNRLAAYKDFVSARRRQKVNIHKLSKNGFKADENVVISWENDTLESVTAKVLDKDGAEINVVTKKKVTGDLTTFILSPHRSFRPGKYKLVIEDPLTNTKQEQDLTWGVLAINTNKSVYLPGEAAKFSIAVLDEKGMMVCDAKVELKVNKPLGNGLKDSFSEEGNAEILSTENGRIKANPECLIKDYVEKPDYEADLKVEGEGTYSLTLTSQTANGIYSISDAFEVAKSVPFDVERKTSTRLFPPVTYPVTFEITANEDFDGKVVETVPDALAINELSGVKKYDQIVTVSSESEQSKKNSGIPTLSLPFENKAYPISLGFGETVKDPIEKEKYDGAGVAGHDGIDFDLPVETPVLAVDDGEVVLVNPNGVYGGTLVIRHAWGQSYYGHLGNITAAVGKKIKKGWPLGLSGSTGISTHARLHFGIKPNNPDVNNGYYGKVDPVPYFGLKDSRDGSELITVSGNGENVKQISWDLSVKKGEKFKLGYGFRVPNISPNFYLIGPLKFIKNTEEAVFLETRNWQLAVDADGSGTNTVSPNSGSTSASGQTYTFTFTAAETMDSGGITITVPSGWTAPQGTNGVAGYTTAVGNSNATVARVLNNADSITGWAEDDTDMCNTANLAVDGTTKQEGTNSIVCNNSASALMDASDSFSLDFTSENWTSYTQIGVWVRTTYNVASGDIVIGYDDATNCGNNSNANLLQSFNFTTTANTWEYKKFTLTASRTAVVAFCVNAGNDGLDNDQLWIDDILIGPGDPTFSGSGPWTINMRILDAANTETFTITYGSGGGSSGVTNSSVATTHEFTTDSRISDAGSLTNIATDPTVTLTAAGPTTDQQMRHGNWFTGGSEASTGFSF